MSFRKPCHMPFRKLIPPFTLTGNSKTFFASNKKKPFKRARDVMARTVQLLKHDAYCPIKLSY